MITWLEAGQTLERILANLLRIGDVPAQARSRGRDSRRTGGKSSHKDRSRSRHRDRSKSSRRGGRNGGDRRRDHEDPRKCWLCKKEGHVGLRRDCPKARSPSDGTVNAVGTSASTDSVQPKGRKYCLSLFDGKGNTIEARLDSGAAVNIMPESLAKELELRVDEQDVPPLHAANHTQLDVRGRAVWTARWGRKDQPLSFVVARGVTQVLLATPPPV